MKVKRGEIYMVDFPKGEGSEQYGKKPCVIIQCDEGNESSTTTIVAIITTAKKNFNRTHVNFELFRPSTVLCEQIRTISKSRLHHKVGELPPEKMSELDKKLKISLGIK